MNFRFFKQYDQMDCGPTCLLMVASYYGKSVTLADLREQTQIGKEGVNLLGISEAAENLGFRTQSVKINFTTLKNDALLPAIIHWNQNHFVVLYKIKNNKFYIADPAKGKTILNSEEVRLNWVSDKSNIQEEGIALLLEPGPSFNEIDDIDKESYLSFGNIYRYILPYKKLIFQLFLGLGAASILQLIFPFLTQSIVDVGINNANLHFIYIVLLAQLALFLGRITIDIIRSITLPFFETNRAIC